VGLGRLGRRKICLVTPLIVHACVSTGIMTVSHCNKEAEVPHVTQATADSRQQPNQQYAHDAPSNTGWDRPTCISAFLPTLVVAPPTDQVCMHAAQISWLCATTVLVGKEGCQYVWCTNNAPQKMLLLKGLSSAKLAPYSLATCMQDGSSAEAKS
jgi:hypothetical protein